MKISEILHEAADVHLWNGIGNIGDNCQHSCCAVAAGIANGYFEIKMLQIKEGLTNMGVNVSSFNEFSEFPYGEQRQAARYTWLKFAAMIAEEQGV